MFFWLRTIHWWQLEFIEALIEACNHHDVSDYGWKSLDGNGRQKNMKVAQSKASQISHAWLMTLWQWKGQSTRPQSSLIVHTSEGIPAGKFHADNYRRFFNFKSYLAVVKFRWNIVNHFNDDFRFLIDQRSTPAQRQSSTNQKEKRKPEVNALRKRRWRPK